MDYSFKNEDLFDYLALKFRHSFVPNKGNDFKPKFLQSNTLFYFAVFLFAVKFLLLILSFNFPSNLLFADITRNAIINLTNDTRSQAGLPILKESMKLDEAAKLKAQDMVENGYFSHNSPTGKTPWFWFLKTGYSYKYAGENLAIGFLESKEVYDAWINSLSHRENILNPNFHEIGIAVLKGFGDNNATVVVQLLGTPRETAVSLNVNNEKNIINNEEKITETPVEEESETGSGQIAEVSSQVAEKNLTENQESGIVLSESDAFRMPMGESDNLYLKFFNFALYRYDELLEVIVFSVLSIVISAFLLNIFVNMGINDRIMLARSALIIAILIATAMLDRASIATFIPHEVSI